jgi:pyrroline-5-carboxylate reductase
MGQALLQGWLAAGTVSAVEAVEPNVGIVPADPRVGARASVADVPADFRPDAVLVAVKPQMMDTAAPGVRPFVGDGTVVVSIAAGKTLAYFTGLFGAATPVVRAMPNTPAAVGRGMTVCCATPSATSPIGSSPRSGPWSGWTTRI